MSIADRLKEAGVHTVIYGLGSVLQTALGFVLIPLYTRQFTTDLYGAFTLIALVGTVAGTIWGLGASSALGRSYFDYDDPADRRRVVGTSLWTTLFGAAVLIFLGSVVREDLSVWLFGTADYGPHVMVVFVSAAAHQFNGLFYMLLRFLRRSVAVVTLNLVTLGASTVLILYFLLVLDMGVMAPLLGTLLGRALVLVVLVWVARSEVSLKPMRREFRIQLAYGIPNVVVGLLYYGLDSIDRLFINEYLSLSEVGVYSLGYKLAMVIQFFFIMPFSQIWAPMRVEYRHEEQAPRLFSLVLTYFIAIGLVMTVGMSVFAREIVTIVSGRAEYVGAYTVVPVVMLAHLTYGAINIVDNGIVFERRLKYHIYNFAVALLVNIGLNVVFIPRFGYIAAAYSTLVAYAMVALIAGGISNRWYPVKWEWSRLGKLFVSAVIVVVVGSSMPPGKWPILLKMGLVATLIGWWYHHLLDDQERAWLRTARGGARGRSS